MRLPCGFHLPIHGQALDSVLADRFEHHEARLTSLLLCLLQQTLINERSDGIQGLCYFVAIANSSANCLDCLQGAAVDED